MSNACLGCTLSFPAVSFVLMLTMLVAVGCLDVDFVGYSYGIGVGGGRQMTEWREALPSGCSCRLAACIDYL